MNKQYVAICEKVALTIEEAAEYSNIGQNRISGLLKEPRCPFEMCIRDSCNCDSAYRWKHSGGGRYSAIPQGKGSCRVPWQKSWLSIPEL